MKATSSGASRKLTGTTIAPRALAANIVSRNLGTVRRHQRSATRSPAVTPRRCRGRRHGSHPHYGVVQPCGSETPSNRRYAAPGFGMCVAGYVLDPVIGAAGHPRLFSGQFSPARCQRQGTTGRDVEKTRCAENPTRLDPGAAPALARAMENPGWERLEASLVSGRQVEPDLRAHQRRGRGWCCAGRSDGRCRPGRTTWPGRPGCSVRRRRAPPFRVAGHPRSRTRASFIGVPFYVMEKVDGYAVRATSPAGVAESAQDRHAIADVLVDTLADSCNAARLRRGGPAWFRAAVRSGERQARRWGERVWSGLEEPVDVLAVGRTRLSAARRPADGAQGERSRTEITALTTAQSGHGDAAAAGGNARLGNPKRRWANRWPTSACSL